MRSWPVQAGIAALLVALVAIAFARSSRTFGEGPERARFRIAILVLGALFVLQAVLTVVTGRLVTPVWLLLIELIWLFALWLYYFFRLISGRRSGVVDPETQRRGAALDGAIARYGREREAPDAEDSPGRPGSGGRGAACRRPGRRLRAPRRRWPARPPSDRLPSRERND